MPQVLRHRDGEEGLQGKNPDVSYYNYLLLHSSSGEDLIKEMRGLSLGEEALGG